MLPISIAHKSLMRAMIAYYHCESRRLKCEALPQHMSVADFDTFRASRWDPNVIPTPWMRPLPANQSDDKELVEWQKITKPVYTDYPTLTDSANVNRFIEQWESVSQVHQLEKTLDETYVPSKHEIALRNRKCQWMFMSINKNVKHPSARPFVIQHVVDMNSGRI